MNITIPELLEGKATIIKNKTYLSTKEFVEPFLDKMSKFTSDFTVDVKLANQLSVGDEKDLLYNRVLIQAVLPEEQCIDEHDEVIGFLYGLDIRKPVAKLYRGYLNQVCTNLTVFNPQWIKYQEIIPDEALEYNVIDLMEEQNNLAKKLSTMKSDFLPIETRMDKLGEWVDFSLKNVHFNGIHSTKLPTSLVIDGYKSLYLDDSSEYYVGEKEESSMFNTYNAFTQVLTNDKKDIMNKFEKTLLINQMLNLN